MKTLDEVIAELEDEELFADALFYLKEYKSDKEELDSTRLAYLDILTDYVALKNNWAEQQANPALSWEELKQMEGKPVWVEHVYYKKWLIVKDVYEETIVLDGNGFYTQYFSDDNEKETRWQAYRKERG